MTSFSFSALARSLSTSPKISGIPESHIIGSGTILDTSRLQSTLAKRFCISPKNVHAHVYGEHGDSSFVPWSLVHIANNHVNVYRESSPDRDRIKWDNENEYAAMEEFVRTSGGQVIKAKGATFYAVAMSVCHLCGAPIWAAGSAITGTNNTKRCCLTKGQHLPENSILSYWTAPEGGFCFISCLTEIKFRSGE